MLRFGWMGVDLFFVLSGYLIGSQFLRPYLSGNRPSWWSFYRNRLFRVLPAYLFILVIYYLVPIWREDTNLPPLWQLLTFTQNLFVDYPNHSAFSHVWSLCVEEHFYLLLPLVVFPLMRKPSFAKTIILLTSLVLFGICVRSFILFHWLRPMAQAGQGFGLDYLERIYYPTYSRLDGLLAGITLALVKTFRPVWWSKLVLHGHTLFCLGIAVIGIAMWLFKDRWQSVTGASAFGVAIGFPLLSIGLALLVASALSSNGLLRQKIPGAQLIATLAYSLYLTHKELFHLVDRCFADPSHAGGPRWVMLYAVACLLAASALYLCVERPFLVLRDKHRNASGF